MSERIPIPDTPFNRRMAQGHFNRTGHELRAHYVPAEWKGEPDRMVRRVVTCCGPDHEPENFVPGDRLHELPQLRIRYADWREERARLSETEPENDPDEWADSDDQGCDLLHDIATALGWEVVEQD